MMEEVRELFDTYKRLNPEWKPDEHDMDGLEYLLVHLPVVPQVLRQQNLFYLICNMILSPYYQVCLNPYK